ncbi:Sigma-70, region 4 [Pseudobacteriovorax antillogorgiicola]|uniref:Sigma-70, region 4 n=1 Tax=Pseudobacteriovorax antillogorgiicola TaxID=1513793 RepID=A0A1Y6BH82_9BACT|nr:sigma-70-like protein [Pseudobacteriovorax antillogorgiicola]SMF11028.1 Sigma-70, region 4 [Pseudobacteriovorax antillogorgiicola]
MHRLDQSHSDHQTLQSLFDQLPKDQKTVLTLKFKFGLSYKTISRATGIDRQDVARLIPIGMDHLRGDSRPESSTIVAPHLMVAYTIDHLTKNQKSKIEALISKDKSARYAYQATLQWSRILHGEFQSKIRCKVSQSLLMKAHSEPPHRRWAPYVPHGILSIMVLTFLIFLGRYYQTRFESQDSGVSSTSSRKGSSSIVPEGVRGNSFIRSTTLNPLIKVNENLSKTQKPAVVIAPPNINLAKKIPKLLEVKSRFNKLSIDGYNIKAAPWNRDHKLLNLRIRVQKPKTQKVSKPSRNLVYIFDTSGSMFLSHKLPAFKADFYRILEHLDASDTISFLLYSSRSHILLPPTAGDQKDLIRNVLETLQPLKSKPGKKVVDLRLAQDLLAKHQQSSDVSRILVISDGDLSLPNNGFFEGHSVSLFNLDRRNHREIHSSRSNIEPYTINTLFRVHHIQQKDFWQEPTLAVNINPSNIDAWRVLRYQLLDQSGAAISSKGTPLFPGESIDLSLELVPKSKGADLKVNDVRFLAFDQPSYDHFQTNPQPQVTLASAPYVPNSSRNKWPGFQKIKTEFKQHRGAFRRCYEHLLKETPQAKGYVSLLIQTSSYKSSQVKTLESDFSDPGFQACINRSAGHLRHHQLPQGSVSYILPLKFFSN